MSSSYKLTQLDLEFYSTSLLENAKLLHLGLEDSILKDEAYNIYTHWKDFITNDYHGDIKELVTELAKFKFILLGKLFQGEWIGWFKYSFVLTMYEELQYFQAMINGTYQMPHITLWLCNYSQSVIDMLDPIEHNYKVRTSALNTKLQTVNNPTILQELDYLKEFILLLQDITTNKILNVISPLLSDHWVNNCKFLEQALQVTLL